LDRRDQVVARSKAKEPAGRGKTAGTRARKSPEEKSRQTNSAQRPGKPEDPVPRRNGGWREIEALREKAALKASLADVWDEDFDLDEEILAELDHTAEFFTTQDAPEEPEFAEEDEVIDEFFDEDEV